MRAAPSTLFRYLGRQFLFSFAVQLLVLLGIVLLFDVVELLRRAASHTDIPLSLILSMSLMKLPYLAQNLLPMGVLFAAVHTCWRLNKSSELVVIRSAGLSAWQFLGPLVACALAIGFFSTTIVNPVAALLLGKYNRLDSLYFSKAGDLVTISKTGIWLRQPAEEGYALLHSESLNQQAWQLNNVVVIFFDAQDSFLRRLDAPVAYLRDGFWEIRTPVVNDRGGVQRLDSHRIPTALTSQKIEESLADPETISFWSIPEYIHIMEETGFPAVRLRIHFQALLAQPFLLAAMILLAATFSLHPPRFGGAAYMIALGVGVGFLVFFVESMLQAFGASQKIPAHLAAWAAPLIGLLLGGTALLHLEDG